MNFSLKGESASIEKFIFFISVSNSFHINANCTLNFLGEMYIIYYH